MKVLVCGGRDYADKVRLFAVLDHYNEELGFEILVHGAARGADRLAGEWADERGIEVRRYPADWNKHGKSAGPIRNREMVEKESPDLVVAFPGGSGTRDMVKVATHNGITVIEV